MYAVNKILTDFGCNALSFIETMEDYDNLDLIELLRKDPKSALLLSNIFYPKSLLYKKDFEYIENVFRLCGSDTLDAYINILKYYILPHRLDNGATLNYNINITIDTMLGTDDINSYVVSDSNYNLRLISIKLPLKSLGDNTLLNYSRQPQNLLNDVLTKSDVNLLSDLKPAGRSSLDRRYTMQIMDLEEINISMPTTQGYTIGSMFIKSDMACISIMDTIYSLYIRNNILYSTSIKQQDICDIARGDTDFNSIFMKMLSDDTDYMTISQFLESLRGFAKDFIHIDLDGELKCKNEADEEFSEMYDFITDKKTGKINTSKIEEYINILEYNRNKQL